MPVRPSFPSVKLANSILISQAILLGVSLTWLLCSKILPRFNPLSPSSLHSNITFSGPLLTNLFRITPLSQDSQPVTSLPGLTTSYPALSSQQFSPSRMLHCTHQLSSLLECKFSKVREIYLRYLLLYLLRSLEQC